MANLEVLERRVEYKGRSLRVFAVRIDGQLVSDNFAPFNATTNSIHSRICEECYSSTEGSIVSCGFPDIAARRHGETIYWFAAQPENVEPTPVLPNALLNQLWTFAREDYEGQLHSGSTALSDFGSADIQVLLNRGTIYPPELGLFTLPDLEDDPQGRGLLETIGEIIRKGEFAASEAPAKIRSVLIGVEIDRIPEVIVEIGQAKGHCALRFVANPAFPVWVTSDEIQRSLARFAG